MTTTSSTPTHHGVRPPAVAGTFYPATAQQLRTLVNAFLQQATRSRRSFGQSVPKALIVPHAGYRYSGQVAARGYAQWIPAAETIQRVVLLGPAHHHAIDGIAATSVTAFETPLGPIGVDVAAVDQALQLPGVEMIDAAHAREHCLEVQLPFLQVVLPEFEIVPLVVGRTSPSDVEDVIDTLWNGPETVFVVSSDLSHFHEATEAEQIDAETARRITDGEWSGVSPERACGALPIQGLIPNVTARGGAIETLALTHSGAVGGPLDRVVGYGAFAVTCPTETSRMPTDDSHEDLQPETDASPFSFSDRSDSPGNTTTDVSPLEPLSKPDRRTLLRVAVDSIKHRLTTGRALKVRTANFRPRLQERRASFVTLRKDGTLRGCVGNVRANTPLVVSVARSAANAAFGDQRFEPLEADELPGLSIHVSILSQATRLFVDSESDLLGQLRPGVDGLILEYGETFGLFLPSVWEQLSDPATFVRHLKVKAKLPEDAWSTDFQFSRFTVDEFEGTVPA